MTKQDFLAKFIVNLPVENDRNSIYYYYRNEGNAKVGYLEVSNRIPRDNDEYYSINIELSSNGKLNIDGIEDKDVPKASVKEFYKQLKEKYDQQQEIKLGKAWMEMGVYE